jgi:hypothetical protein
MKTVWLYSRSRRDKGGEEEEETSPNSSLSSSVSSSYGSPSSDMHQLRDLRHQFDDQVYFFPFRLPSFSFSIWRQFVLSAALLWIRFRFWNADPEPGAWKLNGFPAFQKGFCTFVVMFLPCDRYLLSTFCDLSLTRIRIFKIKS